MHLHWNECTWHLLCGSPFVFEQRFFNEVVDSLTFYYSDIFASSFMQWKCVPLKPATELNATKQIPAYFVHFVSPTTAVASINNGELILLTEHEFFFSYVKVIILRLGELVVSNHVVQSACSVCHWSYMHNENAKIGLTSHLKHCKNWTLAVFSESQCF